MKLNNKAMDFHPVFWIGTAIVIVGVFWLSSPWNYVSIVAGVIIVALAKWLGEH